MTELDPRLNAYRPDLADERLKGQVEAERFVKGRTKMVRYGVVTLKRGASDASRQDTQLLSGERVLVFEEKDGWAWLQNERDGYVGYLKADALSDELHESTHQVKVLRTQVYPTPDLKEPPLDWLTFSGEVAVTGEQNGYFEIATGGWVFAKHLAELGDWKRDHVESARLFLGTPYAWGGKESLGLDCSGLVQVALHRAGMRCLRDTSHQMHDDEFAQALPPDTTPQYGDIIYWKGHVVIALDETTVINATGGPMLTVIEPLADIDARATAESGEGVQVIRRL